MRFILLNSPFFESASTESEQYLPPLGLVYIATYLEKAGLEVELVDCIKNHLSVEDIIDYLNSSHPNFIGINVFTQNFDIVKHIIESIDFYCECFIGGQVVKSVYEDILLWNSPNPLNIIIGEGELIIPAIATGSCIETPFSNRGQIKVYKVNKESFYFPNDISNIELNRKFIPDEVTINKYNDKECAIITSRGCLFDCAFCGGARSLNRDVNIRIRSEESVISEIEEICKLYPDIQSIRILDDLFLRNSESIDKAYRIFSRFPNLKWRGMVHTLSIINALDKIDTLSASNCRELFIGIESGSERIRKKINKLGTIDEIIKVATTIMNEGIDLKGYFIYGFPQETEEDFKMTYELAVKLKEISNKLAGDFRTSVFQFRPYHGTQLYNEIIESTGIIHEARLNFEISRTIGRSQFNIDFGNYSQVSDDILNEYIIKTQGL